MDNIETERGRWKGGPTFSGGGGHPGGGKGKYIEPKAKGRQRLTHSKKIKKQERITKQQSEKADKRKAHRLREGEKKREGESGKYIYICRYSIYFWVADRSNAALEGSPELFALLLSSAALFGALRVQHGV